MNEDKISKAEQFIKENSTLFKKYKVKKKLGEGAFGDVYMGSCIENNELVAIKVEQRKILKPLLETEAFFLYSLKGLGIPEVLSFGRLKQYNVLVEPLLDKSLFDLFVERRKKLPLEDICLISKQIIDRIQWVHSKYIVHRDIKPDNFLIGRKDPNIIYLIDFGLSKKYKSSKTGKHIRFSFTGKLTGTVRFASANALRGGEQSRRDDLESIGYMIIYFMRGKLPWQGVTGNKKMERYLKIYKMKKNVTPEDLCKSLPKEMTEFMRYVKHLEFEQDPNYNYLRGLFNSILRKITGTNDKLIFSWIKLADLPHLKNPANPATRRDSPQSRLYRKIQQNLDNDHKRNNSSDNDSGQNSFQTYTVKMNPNMGVIKNNSKDTDIETNTNKIKLKEGLNTTVANLNKTLDENILGDFDKPSSNEFGEVIIAPIRENNNDIKKEKKKNNYTVDFDLKKEKKKNSKENQYIFTSFSSYKNKQETQDKSEEKKQKLDLDEKKKEIQPLKLEEDINNDKKINLIPKDNVNNNDNNDKNNIIQQYNDKNMMASADNLRNKNNENEHDNVINYIKKNTKNSLQNSVNSLNTENIKKIIEKNQLYKKDNENNNNKYNNENYQSTNNEINTERNNKDINNLKLLKENNNCIKTNNIISNNNYENNDKNDIMKTNTYKYENKSNDKNDIIKTNTNKYENKNNDKNDIIKTNNHKYDNNEIVENNNDINIICEEKQKENNVPENKKYNKNNALIRQLNYLNNNTLKEEIYHLNNNNNRQINKENDIEGKRYLSNNNINGQNLTNYNNENKEEPNDNTRKKKMMKKIKKINSQAVDKNNIDNVGYYTSSKNINRYFDNSLKKIHKNNNNLSNNLSNTNSNVKINGRKIQSNMKNNYNDIQNLKTEIYQNNNPIDNFEFLPKNSDDNEQKDNQDCFEKEQRNQNNIMKINMNLFNNDNTIKKISNHNSNINTAKKSRRNFYNNIYQKDRINSKNKSHDKNKSNDNNMKNKTLPNLTDTNIYDNEVKMHPNVKKVIINRTKNMKNFNFYSTENKNSYNNNNNLNIIPSDNDEFMNSNPKNRIRKHESNSIDRIGMNNNMNNSKRNNININNNIIINNNINSNIYEKANEIKRNNSKNNYQGMDSFYNVLNKRPSHNIKNNIHSFNDLNQMEINRRPSYNFKGNNMNFYTQIGIEKRPSNNNNQYILSNLMNNNKTPISGGYTKIKKLNNNTTNRIRNFDMDDNYFQENQMNLNIYQNNIMVENQLINNNLIDKVNLINPTVKIIKQKNIQNITPTDTEDNNIMSLKKNKMPINANYYLTDNYMQKDRNISAEVKDKKTLFLEQYQNNYMNFQNKMNNNNLYPNNNMNLYNLGNNFEL